MVEMDNHQKKLEIFQETWIDSDWYKEWLRLSRINQTIQSKCGGWYYNSDRGWYEYIQ